MKVRRCLALFLALCLVLSAVPASVFAASADITEESTLQQIDDGENSSEAGSEIETEEPEESTEQFEESTERREVAADQPEESAETRKASTESEDSIELEDSTAEDLEITEDKAGAEVPSDGTVVENYQEIGLGTENTVYGSWRENRFLFMPQETGWYRVDIEANGFQSLNLYHYSESGLVNLSYMSYENDYEGTRALFAHLEVGNAYVIDYSSGNLSSLVLNKMSSIANIEIVKQSDNVNTISQNSYSYLDIAGMMIKITYDDSAKEPELFMAASNAKFAGIYMNMQYHYAGNEYSWYDLQQELWKDTQSAAAGADGILTASGVLNDTNLYAGTIEGIEVKYAYTKPAVSVEKIEIIQVPAHTEYYQNANIEFDISDLITRITFADGKTKDVTGTETSWDDNYKYQILCYGLSTDTPGTQKVVIKETYSQKTDEFEVTILPRPFNQLEIASPPDKTEYCDGIYDPQNCQGLILKLSDTESGNTAQIDCGANGLYDKDYGQIRVEYEGFNSLSYLAASTKPYTVTVSVMGLSATYEIYVRTMEQLAAGKELTFNNPISYQADALGSSFCEYYKLEIAEYGAYQFLLSSQNGNNGNVKMVLYQYNEADEDYAVICENWMYSDLKKSLSSGMYYLRLYSDGSEGCTFNLSMVLQSGIQSFEVVPGYTDYWDVISNVDYWDLVQGLKLKVLSDDDEYQEINLTSYNYSAGLLSDGTMLVSYDNGFTLSYDAGYSQYLKAGAYEVTIAYGDMKQTFDVQVHNPKTEAAELRLGDANTNISNGSSYMHQLYKYMPEETGYYSLKVQDNNGDDGYVSWHNSKFVKQGSGYGEQTIHLLAGQTYYFAIENRNNVNRYITSLDAVGQLTGLSVKNSKEKYMIGKDDLNSYNSLLNSISAKINFSSGFVETYHLNGWYNYDIDSKNQIATFYNGDFVVKTPYDENGLAKGRYTVTVEYLGLSDSYEVEVTGMDDLAVPLHLNSQETFVFNTQEQQYYYCITPDESGYYVFDIRHNEEDYDFDGSLTLYDEQISELRYNSFYGNTYITCFLEAGKSYYLEIDGVSNMYSIALQLSLTKAEIPKSIRVASTPETLVWDLGVRTGQFIVGLCIEAEYTSGTEKLYMNGISSNLADGQVTLTAKNGMKITFDADIETLSEDIPAGIYHVAVDYLGVSTSYEVLVKTMNDIAAKMKLGANVVAFKKDTQYDYLVFEPQESGYYRLDALVENSGIRYYEREIDIRQYEGDFSDYDTISIYLDDEDESKGTSSIRYLEAGNAYYYQIESSGTAAGCLTLNMKKQEPARSISVEKVPENKLVGISASALLRGTRLKVQFSDEADEEIIELNRVKSWSRQRLDNNMYDITCIYDIGVEAHYTVSTDEYYDGISNRDIDVELSYLGASCTMTVSVKGLEEIAESFTQKISRVSSGSIVDHYYYKYTAAATGNYILNIPRNVYLDVPYDRLFDDYESYSNEKYALSVKEGETYYFRVSDYLTAGTSYEITLQDVAELYHEFSGSETITSDGTGVRYYRFTPSSSGLYQFNMPDVSVEVRWYGKELSGWRGFDASFVKRLEAGQTYFFEIYDYEAMGRQYTLSLEKYTIPADISYSMRKQWVYEVDHPKKYCLDYNVYVDGFKLDYTESHYSAGSVILSDEDSGIKLIYQINLDQSNVVKPGTYKVQIYYFDQLIANDTFEVISLADIAVEIPVGKNIQLTDAKKDQSYYYSYKPSQTGYYHFSAGAYTDGYEVTVYGKNGDILNDEYPELAGGEQYYFQFVPSQPGAYQVSVEKQKEIKSIEVLEAPIVGVEKMYGCNPSEFAEGLKVKIITVDGNSKTISVSAKIWDFIEEDGNDYMMIWCSDGIKVKYRTDSYAAKTGTYTVTVSCMGSSTACSKEIVAVDKAAKTYAAGMKEAVTYETAGSRYEIYKFVPAKTDIYTVSIERRSTESAIWSNGFNRYYYTVEDEGEIYTTYSSFYNGSMLSLQAGEEYYFMLYTKNNSDAVTCTFSLQGTQKLFSQLTLAKSPVKTTYSQLKNDIDLSGIELSCKYAAGNDTFVVTGAQLANLKKPGDTVILTDDNGNEFEAGVGFKYTVPVNGQYYPSPGTNALILSIDSIRQEIPITVEETLLKKIEFQMPSAYEYGEADNMLTDIKVKMVFDKDGTEDIQTVDAASLLAAGNTYDSGYGSYPLTMTHTNDLENAGTKTFTITYMGKKATGNVTINKKKIDKIEVTGIEQPLLGQTPDISANAADSGYEVTSVIWKDAEGRELKPEDSFDGAVRYTVYVTVKPADSNYRFTTATNALVDGKTATSKTSNANGSYTVSYKYSYTDCKVSLPVDSAGRYTISGNPSVGYKGDYTFMITLNDGYSRAGATVKANAGVLKEIAVTGNTYTYELKNVFTNQIITIKDLIENTEGINIKFYEKEYQANGTNTLVDQLTVNSGHSIKENKAPENEMPELEDYVDKAGTKPVEMMFYGWYKDIHDDNTRLKSNTIITLDMAETIVNDGTAVNVLNLSPRFIQKTFRYEYNGVWIVYKILSISEDGKVKLQIANTNVDEVPVNQVIIAADKLPGIEAVRSGANVVLSLESFSYALADGIEADCDITEIAAGAFSGAENISGIKLPNTIETIELGAFAGCTSLETINIPENVTSVPAGTFAGCTHLKEVILPETLESIDAEAFDSDASGITLTCAAAVSELVQNSVGSGFTIKSIMIDFTDYDYSSMTLEYGAKAEISIAVAVNGSAVSGSAMDEVTVDSADKDVVSITRTGNVVQLSAQKVSDNSVAVSVGYEGVTKQLIINTEKARVSLPTVNRSQTLTYNALEQTYAIPAGEGYTISGNKGTNAGGYTASITPEENYQWEDGTAVTQYISWTIDKASPTVHVPTGLKGYVGEAIAKISLPAGFCWTDSEEVISDIGDYTFWATYDSGDSNYLTASCQINVKGVKAVNKVNLGQSSISIKTGEKLTLTATVLPSDAGNKNIKWTSSNEKVAAVSEGLVSALSVGKATIRAASEDNSTIYAECTITVTSSAVAVSSIRLNKKSIVLTKGKTETLIADILPANATDKTITWKSSNDKAATVKNGKVTAVGAGTAVITASAGNISVNCSVTVGYSIKYQLNGGKNNAKNPTVYYKQKVTLSNPAKKGYAFGGWYTDQKLKKKITAISKTAKQDYTLYAKWSKITVKQNKITGMKNNKAKTAAITYSKVSGAAKYEISYSTSSSFKKANTKTITAAATKVSVSKLTKGKTYYVRVRAYVTDSAGEKVYGKWSKVQKIEITK